MKLEFLKLKINQKKQKKKRKKERIIIIHDDRVIIFNYYDDDDKFEHQSTFVFMQLVKIVCSLVQKSILFKRNNHNGRLPKTSAHHSYFISTSITIRRCESLRDRQWIANA
jgi:hypothetical protein